MNADGLRVTAHPSDLDIDDAATAQLQRLSRALDSSDALVKTDRCRKFRLELRVIDQVVMFEGLFDHQQTKIVERPEMIEVCKRVGSVRINGKQNIRVRSEEHTSELQSQSNLVCRLLLEK